MPQRPSCPRSINTSWGHWSNFSCCRIESRTVNTTSTISTVSTIHTISAVWNYRWQLWWGREGRYHEVKIVPPPEKKTNTEKELTPRTSKNKNKHSSQSQFLAAFAAIHQSSQESQILDEKRMQEEALAFQARLEQDCIQFESEISLSMQQCSQLPAAYHAAESAFSSSII